MAGVLRRGPASRTGPAQLTAIGLALVGSAFFATDPGTTPRAEMTRRGRIHAVLGAVVFSLAPVSCFVLLGRFRRGPWWRPLRGWTAAAGTATAASVVLLSIARPQPPAPPNALTPWSGLMQRTVLVTYVGWVFAVAWRLGTGGGASEAGGPRMRGAVACWFR